MVRFFFYFSVALSVAQYGILTSSGTRTLICFRAANAFIYYGLSLNSTSIIGNKYLNFALVCLIEIPGYTVAWISIQHLGRRTSIIGFFFLCGATCIASTFVPERKHITKISY